MGKVQIRLYNDFTKTIKVKVEAQEMEGYKVLFSEEINRENLESVISDLKSKYPNYEMCEFII